MGIRVIVLVLSSLALLSASAGGGIYYFTLKKSILTEARRQSASRAQAIKERFSSFLHEQQKPVRALAGLEELRQALTTTDKESLLAANLVLDEFRKAVAADVCYVMDTKGNTLASSNRNDPDSFVGENFAFRPYFQEAIQGKPAVYMALGVVSKKRGVYFSHPVGPRETTRPAGIVTIKASIAPIEKELNHAAEEIVLLTDPHGIVFVSNRPDWLFHSLWKLSSLEMSNIGKTLQFGSGPFPWVGLESQDEDHAVDRSGNKYLTYQMPIDGFPRWKVVYLRNVSAIHKKLANSVVSSTRSIIVVLCSLVGLAVTILYLQASSGITQKEVIEEALREAQRNLELRVKQATAELVESNKKLKREIDERKRAETTIRKNEKEYRSLVENAPVGIFSVDSDGNILRANRALAEMLGAPSVEAVRTMNTQTSPSLIRTGVSSLIGRCLKRGEPQSVEAPFTSEWGKTIISRLIVVPVFDEAGILYACQGVTEDVTERKKAEEALAESETRYRSLFEESRDAILLIRPGGRIMEANPACAELFGAPSDAIVGSRIQRYYWDPSDCDAFLNEIDQKGFATEFDWKARRADGIERDCSVTSSAWRDADGTICGYITIVRDSTESKRLEQQLAHAHKMESIGTLASGIAHDFNNLLQIVLGYSDIMLADRTEEDKDWGRLTEIRNAARDGADLVRGLLTFSRKVESNPRPIDLNHEVKRAENLLCRTLPKMIEIELLLEEDLKTVNADPTQMEQIILNLAVNAQHAMPKGGRLTIETKNVILDEEYCKSQVEVEPNEYVLLEVSDTGHGIDESDLEYIFEPFFTTKGPREGTGLGLSTVYGIVRNHNGHVTCSSKLGKGTSFRIYLPAFIQEPGSGLARKHETITFGTETVLLVDDDHRVRHLGRDMLTQGNYTVLTAENGSQAIDSYRRMRREISLVILDLIMPGMGGKQCLEALLKIDPDVKVLVASGYDIGATKKEAMEAGAKGFISKPFDAVELLEMVRKVLDVD